jgi:DNA-binding Xre family transcriptional regulator
MDYGALIQAINKSPFKSQNALAKELGLDQSHLNKILNRKERLTVELLERICNALNIHPYHFLTFNPNSKKR